MFPNHANAVENEIQAGEKKGGNKWWPGFEGSPTKEVKGKRDGEEGS